MGRDWSRGLTAATDARVARFARGHVGLKYERRTPPELCRWRRGPRVQIGPIPWSAEFAYALGLFATDGSMSFRRGGAHMGFWSKDRELVETFVGCLGLRTKVRRRVRRRFEREWVGYETSFSSIRLYRWYEQIGLMPRKSLVLGGLAVPEEFFLHTVRGLLDGDGSVARYVDARGRHCFSLRFYSASEAHAGWLRRELELRLGARGSLRARVKVKGLGRRPIWHLQYGKAASRRLASLIYADPSAPRLERKWARWAAERETIAVSGPETGAIRRRARADSSSL